MNTGQVEEIQGEKLQAMLDANTYSLCILLKFLLPQLNKRSTKQKKSGVIATSSMGGCFVVKGNITYHCSKVFVNYLIKAVSYELDKANRNVELLSLMPGPVETNMTK